MKLVTFACWNLIKFTALSSFILAMGVRLKDAVSHYYTVAICNQCYDVAKGNPQNLYEWTTCRDLVPNLTPLDNLLFWRGFFGSSVSSPISFVVWFPAVILSFGVLSYFIAILVAFGLQNRGDERGSTVDFTAYLFETSTLFVLLLLAASFLVFQLTLGADGCYQAPYTIGQVNANNIIEFAVFAIWCLHSCLLWTFRSTRGLFFCCTRLIIAAVPFHYLAQFNFLQPNVYCYETGWQN